MLDLPTEPCPKCSGSRFRYLPEAGTVLREHRLERGVSAATMARELAVTRQLVNDWEAGRHRVPQDVPERWAQVCREKGRCGGLE
jgi:predicted transcriptional regulator